MKHVWELLGGGSGDELWRCKKCGLERWPWPLFGLWRPWPRGNHCTGYYD